MYIVTAGKTWENIVFDIFNVHVHVSWCAHCLVKMLTQPPRDFVLVRPLSLRRSANFDIGRATLSALCACRIALGLARC